MNQTNTLPQKDGPAETLRSSGWFASFFKRKPKPRPPELPKEPEYKEPPLPEWFPKWEALRQAYPVGREFEYLGRKMVVTRRRPYHSGCYAWPLWVGSTMPAIIAEYADERGVIHEHAFDKQPWELLQANNPVTDAEATP